MKPHKQTAFTRYCTVIQIVLSLIDEQVILIIILWNYSFNGLNFKYLGNLVKHKFLKLPEDDTEVLKHVAVNII